MRNTSLPIIAMTLFMITGCSDPASETGEGSRAPPTISSESLEEIAYDAFIYAYPLMEQVKTVNGMFEFMGLGPNHVAMNTKLPRESVGMPIVAPNLTSMTGGVFIDNFPWPGHPRNSGS